MKERYNLRRNFEKVEVIVIEKNCKNTAKNFDRFVTQTLCSRQKCFSCLFAVTNLHLELDVWSSLLTSLISELGTETTLTVFIGWNDFGSAQ